VEINITRIDRTNILMYMWEEKSLGGRLAECSHIDGSNLNLFFFKHHGIKVSRFGLFPYEESILG
jgi:hypothetical protein